MRVLVTAVGQRTEHWTDLFGVLADHDDLDVTAVVSDVSDLTVAGLQRCAERSDRFRYHVLPHAVSESRTGHMASIVVKPAVLRDLALDDPDLIHVIGEPSYLSTSQFTRWRRRRWPTVPVTHYAAQNVVMKLPPPFPQLEQRAYRAIDHMLPITPAALRVLRAKGYTGGASVVPLGVDTTRFRPRPEARPDRPFTVGFVGRMEAHKGIAELIAAAEAIDADLLLVGAGRLEHLVDEAAARRPGRVVREPWCDHDALPAALGRMDVLVLPSVEIVQHNVLPWIGIPLREQFGRVLVEAMACGVPVIGSEVGEIPHVIGSAGLVYPAGDGDALAKRLTELRNDRELADELGRLGIERANAEFSWDHVAAVLRGVWDEVVTTGRSRRVARSNEGMQST